MKKIEFIYKGKTETRLLPSSWDEVTPQQLLEYSRLSGNNTVTAHDIAIAFLNPNKKILFRLNRGQVDAIARELEWLWTTDITTTTFPVQAFWHRGIKYHGPGNNLKHTTVEEIAMADNYLALYAEDNNEHNLNLLVATLYRPTNLLKLINHYRTASDIRCPVNSLWISHHAKRINSAPLHLRKAIMYSFLGCRNYTRHLYPFLYDHKEKNKLGWASTIISMAGPELGTIEQVGSMLWNNALIFMVHSELLRQKTKQPGNQPDCNHNPAGND